MKFMIFQSSLGEGYDTYSAKEVLNLGIQFNFFSKQKLKVLTA